jgi:hypothetical protein
VGDFLPQEKSFREGGRAAEFEFALAEDESN